jgi:ABC-type transport system involved in multi-copper enzyme maturation permease subunit
MASSFSSLSPFGPIFAKELRTTARRKRTYWLRLLYLAALFLFMLMVYTSTAYRQSDSLSVAERAQQEAELGYEFFTVFSMFSICALLVISPVLTATAISAERLSRTLPVLLMTPITNWQIVAGKLLSRLLAALTLIGLSLPVLAVVRLLGGVEMQTMLYVLGVCVVASLSAAAIGLFYSTFVNRAYAVILLSYATMMLIYGLIPFIIAMFFAGSRRPPNGFFEFFCATNPIAMVAMLVIPGGPLRGATPVACILVHLGMAPMLVFWSGAVLRRRARQEGEASAAPGPGFEIVAPPPVPPTPPPVILTAGPDAAAAPEIPGPPPPAHTVLVTVASRDVSDNPVLWREVRQPLMKKRWQARIGTIACIALLLLTYIACTAGFRNELPRGDTQIGYAIIFCGLLCLLTCVLAATTIASEKESDTWTLLLATPIGARAIVLGKLMGILRRLLWPYALVFGHFLLFTLCGVLPVSALVMTIWIIVTFNAVWVASGLLFSLWFRKVTFAVILNLLMPIVAYLGVFVVLTILTNVVSFDRNDRTPEFVGLYAPYPYLAIGIDGLTHPNRYYGSSNPLAGQTYHFSLPMHTQSVGAADFFSRVFGVGLAYLAVAAAIVGLTIRRFDKIVGRAHQGQPL